MFNKLLCSFGFHEWNGCRCNRCGHIRDFDHHYPSNRCEEKCLKCGKKLEHDLKQEERKIVDHYDTNITHQGGQTSWDEVTVYQITYRCQRTGCSYEESKDDSETSFQAY